MLIIDIPSTVYEVPGSWDGKKRVKKLMTVPPIHLEMEHSLLSISKWESKWKIPFVECQNMTPEQFIDYCRCMTINRQKDQNVYQYLMNVDAQKIGDYMADSMSARILSKKNSRKGQNRTRMTSDYFYYMMIQLGIPFECEKWHFGRLMALIDCCQANSGNEPPMSYRERQKYYAELNAQRRRMLGTKG